LIDDEKIDDDDAEKIENLKVQFDCENKRVVSFIYRNKKKTEKQRLRNFDNKILELIFN